MHESEGARLGLEYAYRLFDFDELGFTDWELGALIGRLRDTGYAGLNITHPFKERVIAQLDDLAPDAAMIGAVNTVVFRDGRSIGHNTDCWGFGESFRRGLAKPPMDTVALIGAGGAGMAVAQALLGLGVGRLAVFDVDRKKSERLKGHIREHFGGERVLEVTDLQTAVAAADGLVNATPVGMAKYPGTPLKPDWLRPAQWVSDIVYFPAETELLRDARRLGCQVLTGSGMAIFQAVKAFELITGITPDADKMSSHFQTG
jgi:shikimate dehydrogenase